MKNPWIKHAGYVALAIFTPVLIPLIFLWMFGFMFASIIGSMHRWRR